MMYDGARWVQYNAFSASDESPAWAKINADLTPTFKGNPKVTPRAPNDPPHNPANKLVK